MNEKSKVLTFMGQAILAASNSTCISHQVGCVIVKDGRPISSGVNGSLPGFPHCDVINHSWKNTDGTINQEFRILHRKWSEENEVHAERNAFNFASKYGIATENAEMYCTLSPCTGCIKDIIMNKIKRLYILEVYDFSSEDWKEKLVKAGVEIFILEGEVKEYLWKMKKDLTKLNSEMRNS